MVKFELLNRLRILSIEREKRDFQPLLKCLTLNFNSFLVLSLFIISTIERKTKRWEV